MTNKYEVICKFNDEINAIIRYETKISTRLAESLVENPVSLAKSELANLLRISAKLAVYKHVLAITESLFLSMKDSLVDFDSFSSIDEVERVNIQLIKLRDIAISDQLRTSYSCVISQQLARYKAEFWLKIITDEWIVVSKKLGLN